MQLVHDDNGFEIGWLVDAWKARCYGWNRDVAVPLPDYQCATKRRSRLNPNQRSIPDIEYDRLKTFIECVVPNKGLQEMASFTEELSSKLTNFSDQVQLCWHLSKSQFRCRGPVLKDYELIKSDIDQWCNTLILNQTNEIRPISAFGSLFYQPANSSFLISDISHLSAASLLPDNSRYHLVMMDPPWDNKSAQRSKSYPTLRHSTLKSLPIDSLLDQESGIVIVWLTNDPKLRAFVCDELFMNWNVQFYTVWYWLKLPLKTEINVSDLNGTHHKPYEQMIIGIRSCLDPEMCSIPKYRIIGSFPESHSRKPVVDEILNQYLPSGCKKLELFARDVKPGWVAWGNEPLKFQDAKRFHLLRPNKRKLLSD